jgi:hypothetical protein
MDGDGQRSKEPIQRAYCSPISYLSALKLPAWEQRGTPLLTSRLENPEELQLHHNHENFLFLTVLLLFAQCKMQNW